MIALLQCDGKKCEAIVSAVWSPWHVCCSSSGSSSSTAFTASRALSPCLPIPVPSVSRFPYKSKRSRLVVAY